MATLSTVISYGEPTGTIVTEIGTPGPTGQTGPQGPAGPVGPAGPTFTGGPITSAITYTSGNTSTVFEAGDIYTEDNSSGAYGVVYINGLEASDGTNTIMMSSSGIQFPDTTVQTTAFPGSSAFYPSTGNPSGFLTAASLSGYATESYVTSQGFITQGTADGLYYGIGNPSGFVDAGYVSSALTGYATESWVTAGFYPLTGNPSGFLVAADLSGYLPLAGGQMSGSITSVGTTHDTEMSGEFFGVQLSADHGKGSVLQFNGLDVYDGSSHMQVTPTGLTFPDSTVQTSAAFVPGSGNLDMEGYDITNANFNSSAGQVSAQNVTLSSGGSITFGDSTVQTTAYTGGGGYITSVTSPLAVTSGDLSIDLSGYATESFVTSQGYITQGTADGLYYSISNPSGFIAFDSYNRLKFTPLSSVPSYWTQGELYYNSNKFAYTTTGNQFNILATEAWVSGTYAPLASPTFSGDPKAPTPATGDNDTSIATTAFVKAQGYLTSAPVTSVAGRTGAITLAVADVSGAAPLASPSLTGVPLGPTATVSTNTTQLATTAFVLGQAGTLTPIVDGTAAVGTSFLYARQDHVHPTDTSRAPLASPSLTGVPLSTTAAVDTNTTQIATTAYVVGQGYLKSATASSTYAPLASPSLTGTPLSTTAAADTNTTQIATTAYVVGQAGSATPLVDGTAAVGTSLRYARQDHVHPTDTTRAPLASPSLTGVPLAPTAAVDTNTTQLATTAYVVGQGYLKSATASSTYAPIASPSLTGVPLSTTAAADTNTTQIATTAFVVGQASSTAPVIDGTATVGTSLKYARADHVHPTDTSRAALNSPAFTGTPSLPTGTTAVTQTAGNNTTAVATTAFVTAAVPAFASVTQSRAATSTTVAQNPNASLWQLMNPGIINIDRIQLAYTATGTMGTSGIGSYVGRMTMGTAGACSANFRTFGVSQIDQAWALMSKGYRSYIDFSKFTWCSGRFYMENAPVDPLCTAAFYYGKASNSANGDLARAGFGWKLTGNATAGLRNPVLQVHNGTTLTNVTSSFAAVAQVYWDWDIISLGNGTVTLYINGTQVATTSAGPSADTSYSGTSPVIWNEEFVSTGTTLGYDATFGRGRIYVAP